jgi:protein ImuB
VTAPLGTSRGGRRAPRFLVLHLPAFRLERCGFHAEEVAVLVAEERSAVRLQALTPAASALGMRRGMTVSEARAMHPGVLVEPLDLEAERIDRVELLLMLARRLSDRVAPLHEEDVVLEVAHVAHLHGSESALAAHARALLGELGHRCRVVVADHPDAAAALARWGEESELVVPPGGLAAALAPLPLVALRPPEALSVVLRDVGIELIGQLARLDRAALVARHGEAGLALHRVACGEGLLLQHFDHWEDEAPLEHHAVLGGPAVTLEPVLFLLPGLLAGVVGELAERGKAVVRLALRLVLEGSPPRVVRVRAGRPTRDRELLLRLLKARLEGLRLAAPAVEVHLLVEQASAELPWQPGWMDRTEGDEDLPALLARLTDELGEKALLAAELVDAWRPERAWVARPFTLAPLVAAKSPSLSKPDPVDPIARWTADLPRPRPASLLPEPEPLEVALARGVPDAVRRRRTGWEQVQRVRGPERLFGDWWTTDAFEREYWTVQVAAGDAWIHREGGAWYLDGWF